MSFQPRVVGRRLTVAVSTRTNIALGAGRREAETGIYKRRWTMAIVNSAGNATFGVVESGGSAFVILTALIILFGAAAYFTGRLYGTPGLITCGAGFVIVVVGLMFLGGLNFG
jgi:hypothetical protein